LFIDGQYGTQLAMAYTMAAASVLHHAMIGKGAMIGKSAMNKFGTNFSITQ
jgi:hypothetical protein